MYIASGQLLNDFTLLASFAYALVLFQALRTAPWNKKCRYILPMSSVLLPNRSIT